LDMSELRLTLQRALERRRLALENARLRRALGDAHAAPPTTAAPSPIVGKSRAMLEGYKTVARAASSPATVLIRGESGTGKELVARTLHAQSPRAERTFVTVNCGALAEGILESELFGHEKGAFTGAHTQRRGLFEEARGGTLFLDEVGDVSPKLQA